MIFRKSWKEAKKVLAVMLAVALFFSGWGNYDFSVLAADELDVTLGVKSAVYTGDEIDLPTIISVKKDADEVTDYSVKWTDEDDEEITGGKVTDTGYYFLEVTEVTDETPLAGTAKFRVDPLDLSSCTVEVEGTYTYNGSEFTPGVTVKNNDGNVVNESVYSVRYANNLNAGTGSVTVDAIAENANVFGSKTVYFSIAAKPLSDDMLSVVVEPSVANAAVQTVDVTVKDGNTTIDSSDYTVTYKCVQNGVESDVAEIISAGTYKVVVQARKNTNYSGSISKLFEITYANDDNATINVSGNSLADSVYRGEVTITPASSEYEICKEETGSYTDSLTFESFPAVAEVYLKSTNGISKVSLPNFSFDNDAPVLDVGIDKDQNTWASNKTITVTATDDNLFGTYYTTNNTISVASEISDISSLMGLNVLNGNTLVVSDNVTNDTIYRFFAVDKAGHVTEESVIVNKIDPANPTVSVKVDDTEISTGDILYKNTSTIKLNINFADEGGSNIDNSKIEFKVADAVLSITPVDGTCEYTFTPDDTGKTEFTVNVKDNAGNAADEYTFTIYHDFEKPTVENLRIWTKNAEGSWESEHSGWINKNTETAYLRFTATDDLEGIETAGLEKITVQIGSEGSPIDIPLSSDETEYFYQIPVSTDYDGDYHVTVIDKAGNENSFSQRVQVDVTDVTFESPTISGTINNGWYNADDLSFNVKVTDTTSKVEKVVATTNASITSVLELASPENGILGVETPNGSGEYKFDVTATDFENRIYYFYAVDNAGNLCKCETPLQLSRDSHVPKTETILFSFTADESDLKDSVSDGQKGFIQTFIGYLKNIFVKTKVTVTLYVEDDNVNGVFSGAKTLKFKYNNEEYSVDAADGYHAYQSGENGYIEDSTAEKTYSIFTCQVPVSEISATAISGRIEIIEITDVAGNSCTPDSAGIIVADDNLIIIDDVAPVLTTIYAQAQGMMNSDNTLFYESATAVDLSIEETNFSTKTEENNGVKASEPVFTVSGTVITGGSGSTNEASISSWDETNVSTEAKATATVSLPTAGTATEIEHEFQLKYKDPSGNWMEGNEGTIVSSGVYTSKKIVVDTLAPKLRTFEVTAPDRTPLKKDGELYFAKNIQGKDDVEITIKIDDNAAYFYPENVKVYYNTEADETWVLLDNQNVSWTNDDRDDRLHTAVYTFDGASDEEHTYQFKITYADRAQNPMINNGATVSNVQGETGAFISNQEVVIDHSAPKMTKLVFDTPVQIFDGETNGTNGTLSVENNVTDKDSRVYFDSNANISFDIYDAYLKASDLQVNIYKRADKSVDFENITTPSQVYRGTFEFSIPKEDAMLAEDAEYYFTISYTDRAGNQTVYDQAIETQNNVAYDGGIVINPRTSESRYVSPIIIMDTVAPVCDVVYTVDQRESDLADYYYSANAVEAVVNVTEMNLDMEKTRIFVKAENINGDEITKTDINGDVISCDEVTNYNGKSWAEVATDTNASRGTDGKLDQRSLNLKFETEARYTVTIQVVDKVKKDTVHTQTFCIDRTVPVIKIVDVDKNGNPHTTYTNTIVNNCLLHSTSDITYDVVNDGTFAHIINKLTFGYFAKAKIRVQMKVHDQISGVDRIVYTYKDSEMDEVTKPVYQYGTAVAPDVETFRIDANDRGCAIFKFELPISFKGTVKAYGIDKANNSAETTPSGAIGVIAETSDKHVKTSKTTLDVVSNYSKTKDYYNDDVKIKFTSQDEYSGLFLIDYLAGNDLSEQVPYDASGSEIVTTEIIRDYTIKASSNNQNNIKLGLRLEDNAGHETKIPEEKLPKIHIDTTKPTVKVEYDNMDVLNEKYYKDDRIATVTVTERNFDPKDVTFELDGPEPAISGWSHVAGNGCKGGLDPSDTNHTDSCSWVCKVHFSEDGDYVFGFKCVDLAGNAGAYDLVDEFTIDKTLPKITVVYDNNSFLNEYYYKEARIATVTIDEHNFSASDVEITMTAKDDGRVIDNPAVLGWSDAGDLHTATIRYNYDGEFTFDIDFTDLAGNVSDDYEPDHFIVDMTAPELEIFDIENMSANNGEVRPGIRYYDTNYDADGTVILMNGYHNGVVEMTGDRKLEAKGLELKLDDFAYEQDVDDLYTMEATVYDLAGNSSEETVMFSVNRFGSVYTFDEATDALIGDNGKYYTNQEQELVITETNVDTLEFKEITCNLNGKLSTLKEGQDYSVSVSGDDATWKQYTYNVHADNFDEEGTYILNIYSEDRATNTSDNNSKGKKVEFVVDKTNPSVLISGVENNGQYRTHSQEMTIDIEDNVRLSQMKVSIDGTETTFGEAQIREADGKFVMNIESANHWQEIKVVVTDAAGNEEILQDLRVLVTANVLVQFYMNKPVFYGTVGGTSAVAASIWWTLIGRKKILIK